MMGSDEENDPRVSNNCSEKDSSRVFIAAPNEPVAAATRSNEGTFILSTTKKQTASFLSITKSITERMKAIVVMRSKKKTRKINKRKKEKFKRQFRAFLGRVLTHLNNSAAHALTMAYPAHLRAWPHGFDVTVILIKEPHRKRGKGEEKERESLAEYSNSPEHSQGFSSADSPRPIGSN